MMMKIVTVILMEVFMAILIHADEMKMVLNTSDFALLCNVTKATNGLLQAVAEASPESEDIYKKELEISNKINEISFFFGKRSNGRYTGLWPLVTRFAEEKPDRKRVCRSKSGSEGISSAPDSLASVILCLCMGTTGDKRDLCNLKVQNSVSWPTGTSQDIKKVFDEVWGEYSTEGVLKKCGNHGGKRLKTRKAKSCEQHHKTRKNTKRKSITEPPKHSLRREQCVRHSHRRSILAKKNKEIEDIAESILTLIHLEAEKKIQTNRLIPVTAPESTNTPNSDSASLTEPTPLFQTTPTSETISSPVSKDTRKQEAREAPTEKQKSEKVYTEIPKKEEENPDAVLEPNEISSSYITNQMWLFLAVLLI
ncbi:Variant surface glycoprotein [Trypanosoma congolense IL3000]|uniref:Variant surface glycoprotein n=1 Tax=Trypanosoma congolense (strain IL3000) TaxID=1068625 RepID=F9WHN4_TRYCI|nr:Variant surface glycoprotein [Trypanosoma congolense IL3000]